MELSAVPLKLLFSTVSQLPPVAVVAAYVNWKSVPVLATVAMKGGGLIAEVKAREAVWLVEVTPENRDRLPGEIEAWVRDQVRPR